MQAFKNLKIIDPESDRVNLISFLGNLKSSNKKEWPYLKEKSEDYAIHIFKELDEVAVFNSPLICNKNATIWLALSGREIRITNIVPTPSGRLSYEEYNSIFDRFLTEMIKPAAKGSSVDIITTGPEVHLEETAGHETYEKLVIWEATTNRSSEHSHPLDFDRWADFLTTAFNYKSKITAQLLQRWLLEDKGWTDTEVVQNLGSEFEYGIDLLNYYVNHK